MKTFVLVVGLIAVVVFGFTFGVLAGFVHFTSKLEVVA